jgi:hypothetical protein
MNGDIWKFWPWISLFLFAILVRTVYRIANSQQPYPYTHGEQNKTSDGIELLLIISIIVGAAVCVLIIYLVG